MLEKSREGVNRQAVRSVACTPSRHLPSEFALRSSLVLSATVSLTLLSALAANGQSAQPNPGGSEGAGRRATSILLELNKLEPASGGCRAYFVVENRTPEAVRELRLDTFIFDANGQIARRIGLTFPDIRPERTKVVPFDLAGAACPEIGRMLVNDVLACTGTSGSPINGCNDLLTVATRASARFEY